ncbi:MAG TPA: biopolymer transporter ExbD [Bacteroidia bacterium]|nr:biopolymer transporter ExbD [Bacteroidia bacterium]MBN8691729.1 biopolymer transporter ExbD [Bacteroidota bacterium]HRD39121.1 biopolymer transporter ExbD [Bacteroidia bacterium]
MGLRKKMHREAEVSTDSLNDIMFFLLLFFLILSTMVSPNAMKVNLPSSKANKPIDNNKKPIHLAVTKERKYFVNSKEVDFGNLETLLLENIAGKTEPVIVLHIDKDLVYQDFIDVMQIGDRLKCKMVCATAPSNSQQ